MDENKVVLLFSGGTDSTLSAKLLLEQGFDVIAVGVDYGQRHIIELAYAEKTASEINVEFIRVDARPMQSILSFGNELVNGNEGAATGSKQGITTLVPNRNMFLLSIAGAIAMSRNARKIAIGFNKDDATNYPDCRELFANAMGDAFDALGMKLLLPTIKMSKAQIMEAARAMGIDVDKTYSCYAGTVPQCGVCGACILRKQVEGNDSR